MAVSAPSVELTLQRLRESGREPRLSGKGWVARRPAHDDHTPSLSINEGDNGRTLLKCHAGCGFEAVVGALELKAADLAPESRDRRPGFGSQEVKHNDYRGESGRLLFQVERREP